MIESPKQVLFSLDSFVGGKNLKIFTSCNENYYSTKYNDLIKDLNDSEFHLFYKDNTKIRLIGDYSSGAIQKFQSSLNDNKNQVYFDHNVSGILKKSKSAIARKDHNYYFINDFKFKNIFQNNNLIQNNNSFRTQFVKNYISQAYLSSFYQNSLLVKDQTVPIYELNQQALNGLNVIKFQSKQIVDDIILQFQLQQTDDLKFLYNSKTDWFDSENYDSLYIPTIYKTLSQKNETKLDQFFKFIFSNLSKDSFYRLLIPVGKINLVSSNITSIQKTNDISQYMYYLNQNNLFGENTLSSFSFNYFDLKNLQNPHDAYDYKISADINQNMSIKSNAFSFNLMNNFKLINSTSNFIKNLQNFINEHYWKTYYSQYIQKNQLLEQIMDFSVKSYDEWTSDTISSILYSQSYIKYVILENAFKQLYNINLKSQSYLINIQQIYQFIQIQKLSFINENLNFEDHKDTSTLFYQCLEVFDDSKSKLSSNIFTDYLIPFNTNIQNYLNEIKNLASYQAILSKNKNALYKPMMKTIFNNSEKFMDYYKMFDTLYQHQNVMRKSGILNGHREYDNVFISFDNYLNATYYYKTFQDINFKTKYEVTTQNQITAYKIMLNEIGKYQFIQKIDGFFKYKDKNLSKSNIYSIQIKNSNLNYQLYSFKDIINYCLLYFKNQATSFDFENNYFIFEDKKIPFSKFINEHNIGVILESNLNQNVDLLKLRQSLWEKIPLTSFKYFLKNETDQKQIYLKLQMRKRLQATIRQSISKYMPVNTTLWKIKYDGI